ncbi:MAG: carboxypeptidase regulatory-like domain-containing protein [Gemmatimonadaceae bacterium]
MDALLSDVFVRDHCFRMVEGAGDKAGLVGLGFRPTSARRVPDITGVLWLDAATQELRRLEFNYTDDPFEGLWQRFPSFVEYARMPSGAWIMRRWSIRMPVVEVERADPTNPLLSGQGPRRRLVAIVEEGAEALLGDRSRSAVPSAVTGTVYDSSTGRPLVGARVSLRGTPFTTTSDVGGRFRLQVPDTGRYMLGFDHARLDSLGFDVPAREIRLVDSLTAADVAVPPLATVRAQLCPGSRPGSAGAIVLGTIRTPTGAPAAWATLRYRWSRFESAPVTDASPVPAGAAVPVLQSAPGATLVADSRGRYLICDVPAGRYRLALESETGESAEAELLIDSGQIIARDLALRRGG